MNQVHILKTNNGRILTVSEKLAVIHRSAQAWCEVRVKGLKAIRPNTHAYKSKIVGNTQFHIEETHLTNGVTTIVDKAQIQTYTVEE